MTAGTTGPLPNQRALAFSMLAATHWNGSLRSAKSEPGSAPASTRRSDSNECRCVPERTSRTARLQSFSLNARRSSSPCHIRLSRSAAPSGSAATSTPFSAPIEVPTTRSGLTPASASARSIPTSCAPSSPPPPRTNAVVMGAA
jgi:hypothetical protein